MVSHDSPDYDTYLRKRTHSSKDYRFKIIIFRSIYRCWWINKCRKILITYFQEVASRREIHHEICTILIILSIIAGNLHSNSFTLPFLISCLACFCLTHANFDRSIVWQDVVARMSGMSSGNPDLEHVTAAFHTCLGGGRRLDSVWRCETARRLTARDF